MANRTIKGGTELLHRSESGIRQLDAGADHIAYARQVSRYISCPTTVRVRTLEQYGKAPPLDAILAMRALHEEARNAMRRVVDGFGEDAADGDDYRLVPAQRRRDLPAAPRIALDATPLSAGPMLVSDIIAAVARAFGYEPADIIGRRRLASIVRARQTCSYVLWLRGNGYASIGRRLGGRDHSTIIHACRQFEVFATPEMRAVAKRFAGCAA